MGVTDGGRDGTGESADRCDAGRGGNADRGERAADLNAVDIALHHSCYTIQRLLAQVPQRLPNQSYNTPHLVLFLLDKTYLGLVSSMSARNNCFATKIRLPPNHLLLRFSD